uniref:Uncharacterized protein n=1 Tax=Arundo donax TaxID=35708 RepID=A0A0A9EZQ0_ARUDO
MRDKIFRHFCPKPNCCMTSSI